MVNENIFVENPNNSCLYRNIFYFKDFVLLNLKKINYNIDYAVISFKSKYSYKRG